MHVYVQQSGLTSHNKVGRGRNVVDGSLRRARVSPSELQLGVLDKKLPVRASILHRTTQISAERPELYVWSGRTS